MWRFGIAIVGFGILIGCNEITPAKMDTPIARASVPPVTVAWGERIDLGPDARTVVITYSDPSKSGQTIAVSQRIFDIPAPPIDSGSLGEATSISPTTYNTPLNPQQYTQRATLNVKNANNVGIGTYYPYGSVVNGEISFLASISSQSCTTFYNHVVARLGQANIPGFGLLAEDNFSILVPGAFSLCSGSVNVGQQTTSQALNGLNTILLQFTGYKKEVLWGGKGFVTDKNTVFNLLQKSVYAYDPQCDTTEDKLDPFSNLGFGLISTAKLRSDLNLSTTTLTGKNVRVNVIGGGSPDIFTCLPGYSFAKHDFHVKSLIQTIAPDVSVQPFTACNSSGVCKFSELGKALMRVVQANPVLPNIINMSLGSPLPNNIMYALLDLLRVRHNMPVFASGGNAPQAPAEYPASYSSGVAAFGQPSLANVIAVASVGWYNGGYRIATFNTRANADVFTQGVNLCPDSVLGSRCLVGQAFPSYLGITGSSFSTAPAVGLMALMIEQKGGVLPANLHACIQNNRKTDAVSGIKYAALMSQPCP